MVEQYHAKKVSRTDLHRDDNGSALLTVFLAIIALTFLGIGLMQYAMSGYRQGIQSERRAMAYYVARSGADAFVSYVVDNPDNLSLDGMGALIDGAVSAGQSAPTLLGEGQFTISLARHFAGGAPDEIVVTSYGTVKGLTETVRRSIILTPGGSAMPPVDCAVFSLGRIHMANSALIEGDVGTNSTVDNSVRFENTAHTDGELSVGPEGDPKKIVYVGKEKNPMKAKVENGEVHTLSRLRSYPLPKFPVYPSLSVASEPELSVSKKSPGSITKDLWFSSISVSNHGVLDIYVGSGTRHIRVDNLSIDNHGQIKIIGEGKLILYVDSFSMENQAQLNGNGSDRQLHLYYSGSAPLTFANSSALRGSVFAKTASVSLENSTDISGHIITGGTQVTISNGVSANVRLVYAPNADVYLSNSAELKGALIGKTVTLSNSAKVTWNDPLGSPEGLDDFGTAPPSYARGLWH